MRRIAVFSICLLVAGGCVWYTVDHVRLDREADHLVEQVPMLSHDLARHLLANDPEALRTYLSRFDARSLVVVGRQICDAVDTTSIDAFTRSRREFYALAEPVFDILQEEYRQTAESTELRQLAGLDPEDGLALAKTRAQGRRFVQDRSLPDAVRIAGLRRLIAGHDAHHLDWMLPHEKYTLSCLLHEQGQIDESLALIKEAIAEAREVGSPIIACQAMGTLGYWYGVTGDFETMARLYEEFKLLALEHDLADQAARACLFLGVHYQQQGRLNLAFVSYEEARRIAEHLKSYYSQYRTQLYLGRFFAALGCWELARQASDGARDHTSGFWLTDRPVDAVLRARVGELEGRYLLHEGQVGAGSREFRRIIDELPAGLGFVDSLRFYLSWGCGLMANSQARQTLAVLDEAASVCARSEDRDQRIAFHLLEAEALFGADELDSCRAVLRDLQRSLPTATAGRLANWARFDALRVQMARREGDVAAASAALRTGLLRLVDNVGCLDASQEGYLLLQSADPLRQVVTEILADRPLPALLAHLLWRQLPRHLGALKREEPAAADVAPDIALLCELPVSDLQGQPLPAEAETVWRRYRQILAQQDAVHLVYAVRDRRVVRWRLDGDGLEFANLPGTTADLRQLTETCRATLGREPDVPGGPLAPAAAADLYELARRLLPADLQAVSADQAPGCIYVTVDDFLRTLPFSALNLSADGYSPLLMHAPLAYVRGLLRERPHRPATGPGLIVAAPKISKRLQRLVGGLEDLDQARREADYLVRKDSRARLLTADDATKPAVQMQWHQAGYLYFAGHVARDPQTPYRSFIPLTGSGFQVLLDGYLLAVLDIRNGLFDATDLVVLSACASGAAYITQTAAAPSLGDAFLDAGVPTTVQTFWSIDDAAGLALMSRFIDHWRDAGCTPARALWLARRTLFTAGDLPYGHPFYWASYLVAYDSPRLEEVVDDAGF